MRKLLILPLLFLGLTSCKDSLESETKGDKANMVQVNRSDVHQQLVGTQKLVKAIQSGDLRTAKECLEKGIDPDFANYKPIIWAALYGNEELVNALIEKNANVNGTTNSGETALMLASMQGNTKIVSLLISAGADVSLKDSKNKSALDYAMDDNFIELNNGSQSLHEVAEKKNETILELAKHNVDVKKIIYSTNFNYFSNDQVTKLQNTLFKRGYTLNGEKFDSNLINSELEKKFINNSIENNLDEK